VSIATRCVRVCAWQVVDCVHRHAHQLDIGFVYDLFPSARANVCFSLGSDMPNKEHVH